MLMWWNAHIENKPEYSFLMEFALYEGHFDCIVVMWGLENISNEKQN